MFAFSDSSSQHVLASSSVSSLRDHSAQMFALAQKQGWEYMFGCREGMGLLSLATVPADVG